MLLLLLLLLFLDYPKEHILINTLPLDEFT